MRFRRRDHESYIGGYDPEHEMPDPDRDPRDRWQSDAYRHNARDSRYWYQRGYLEGWRDRARQYESRGPRDFDEYDRWRWEREYENEYRGRPDDPDLRYDRDRGRRY